MKRILAIILSAAAALAASPAAGQTIKSLGFNTTNGEVVYSGTNPLAFPSLQSQALTIAIGTNIFANLSEDQTDFLVPVVLGSTLAVSNTATFSTNVIVTGNLAVTDNATFADDVAIAGALTVGSLATTVPVTYALDAAQIGTDTNGVLALPDTANILRMTNDTTISAVSNGRLGAFYYLVNQSGSPITIDHTNGITVQGGTPLTLGANQAATLVATGPTNVSVAGRGDLNDVTLGGTLNLAPAQTADSASSLMTRGLTDVRYNFARWYGANEILSGAAAAGANPLTTGATVGNPTGAILVTVSNINTKFVLPVDYRVGSTVKVVSYWTDRTAINGGTNGDIAVWALPLVVQPTTDTTNSGFVGGTQIQSTFTANYGGSERRFYVMEQTLNFGTITNINATNPSQLKFVELQRRGADATDTSSDNIFLSGVHIYAEP